MLASPILAIVLVVRLVMYPHIPPIEIERFQSEKECKIAGQELDASTPVLLAFSCEVDT